MDKVINYNKLLDDIDKIIDFILEVIKNNPMKNTCSIIESIPISKNTIYKKIKMLNNILGADEKIKLDSLIKDMKDEVSLLSNKDEYIPQIKLDIKELRIPNDNSQNNECKTQLKKKDIKELMKSAFSSEVYMYFKFRREHEYKLSEIYDFNSEFFLRYCEDDNKRKTEFLNNYSLDRYIDINGILYYISDRDWIKDNFEEVSRVRISSKLSDYRTIFYNTKNILEEIRNIQNGEIECIDSEKVKSEEYVYRIKNDEDIELYYKKSISELRNKLSYIESIVFNEILNIENGKNKELKIKDIYYICRDILNYNYDYREYSEALRSLIIKGYVHIKIK